MPATMTAAYDPVLSRITLTVSGLSASTARTEIYRWEDGEPPTLARGTIVRGSDIGAGTAGTVHDYEFADGVRNRYALYNFNALGGGLEVVPSTPQDTIPALDAVWLKSVARPFLNRTVTVTDFSDVARPSRGQVVDVLGRRLPVAVTEVRGSRQFELTLRAATAAEVDALATFFSFGDTVFLHVPADCPVPASGHFAVGDVTERRPPKHDSFARYFGLPLTEVDAPASSLVGYTVTWGGVTAAWASWAAVLADVDVPTWFDLVQYVSAPTDEVVG
jgi:hypothetical protein